MMKGACPCGGVTITVARRPEYLNSCNCSLCFRLGALTGYFDPAEVTISGDTKTFIRDDIDPPWIEFPFCPTCGAMIGWLSLRPQEVPRMGVNMRLFGSEALVGLPVRFTDGLNWDEADARPAKRGEDVLFTREGPF